ncbi:MAG: hypothetical protein JWO38_7464 [Gemmataceae bacterium]|nr:hypothetical protein [Gemmataceae bacterium]
MTPRRAALLALLLVSSPAFAQPVNLTETPMVGDCSRYTVELTVTGHLIVTQEGAKQQIKLDAKARHRFAERALAVADGLPSRSARYYDEAATSAVVGGDKVDHALPADRRLIIAHRNPDGPFCFSPAGPVTRDELDLVTEHFDPRCLAGLLPGKMVAVGDTWAVTNPAAQTAGLFDGLVKNQLTGKLVGVKDGVATFTVTGTAEGIEHGAKVGMTVSATGQFHLASMRVVEIAWKQSDDRDQGPVSPASKLEAVVTVRRELLPQLPKELAEPALAGVPGADPPALLTHLRHADPKGRYQLVYPRDWHVTGQTDTHLVFRLVDRGEFVAQATVTVWKKAEPGKHVPADEFKKAVAESPGWVAVRVLEEGEIPTDGGRWLYRLTAEGKMEDLPVVQSFHLLAGPQGDQVVVTVAMKPEKLKAVGTRDVGLVNAIEFGAKK